ncbi:MAG: type II secretion system F family protein [Candidatus Niyogibacteria bacterium]|nr:MAG: type II secretion system F family protein [Candidatus Niyogibacteria bacterium]
MIFNYSAKTAQGEEKTGTVEAASQDLAVSALQRRGLIIVSLESAEEAVSFFGKFFSFFERVKDRDVVIFSRQLATLFSAKVPVVDALRILMSEASNESFKKKLSAIADDIQGGLPVSQALSRHPDIFSNFYIQMARSGEESGKLDDILNYLADYLERSYDLTSKARNALIYPAFVLGVFLVVVGIMLVVVVPKLSSIILEVEQNVPIYTKFIIGLSDFIRTFGVFFLVLAALGVIFVWRWRLTPAGRKSVSRLQLSIPVFKNMYRQIYLARFADNFQTLLSGGVSVARSLEISADVVGNEVYAEIIREARDSVKGGTSISAALARYEDIPPLVAQMIRVGEETGKLNKILETLSRFYRREVDNTLERMVSLIEPALIVFLGLGVGIIVAAILVPIYGISAGI